jgi:hypothetical protein
VQQHLKSSVPVNLDPLLHLVRLGEALQKG